MLIKKMLIKKFQVYLFGLLSFFRESEFFHKAHFPKQPLDFHYNDSFASTFEIVGKYSSLMRTFQALNE